MQKPDNRKPNSLINETSPYLLQHAYNPVNWLAFSEQAFEKAREENKLVLISIGYSACHWCHVMEHESFEDDQIASIMNTHFINVKVDREERSDVDMLYMQAVQLMTGQGGWPLNCFVLPDGQPFYGGTYFRKEQWKTVLQNLAAAYRDDPARINGYAKELTTALHESEMITTQQKIVHPIDLQLLDKTISKWKGQMDFENGGFTRAPKFPLPSNYKFLLRYALLQQDREILDYVNLTLTKMAFGGIYDQLHGGFARYSTDMIWKVPHFEKMLYDNAQLCSLYTEAYLHTKNSLYKEIAEETLAFVEQEWYNKEGYFYAAYDADSDGEEGKYYVWNEADLRELLGEDYEIFSLYYEINLKGYWEDGNYILMRREDISQLLVKYNLNLAQLKNKIHNCKQILKQETKSRLKPGLDDKCITSWNAMMCSAFAQAYLAFGDKNYKTIALTSLQFIIDRLTTKEGKLYRTYKNGKAKIDAFLEDYVFVVEALMNCYLIDQNEDYLNKAKDLTEKSLSLFFHSKSELFFYTAQDTNSLIVRTTEISDNVMPSSNSQMALNLHILGTHFGNEDWISKSKKMLSTVSQEMMNYGSGYSNWACLALNFVYPSFEVAIVGKDVEEKLLELNQIGITNTILAVAKSQSNLPLIKNRYKENSTLIYVCKNNTCKLPVSKVEEAMKYLV